MKRVFTSLIVMALLITTLALPATAADWSDRKSTRQNSSHIH